jgi:hypothetical protein
LLDSQSTHWWVLEGIKRLYLGTGWRVLEGIKGLLLSLGMKIRLTPVVLVTLRLSVRSPPHGTDARKNLPIDAVQSLSHRAVGPCSPFEMPSMSD